MTMLPLRLSSLEPRREPPRWPPRTGDTISSITGPDGLRSRTRRSRQRGPVMRTVATQPEAGGRAPLTVGSVYVSVIASTFIYE